jgi:hypothetical protein
MMDLNKCKKKEPKGVTMKMRGRKLRSAVNWQKALQKRA